MNWRTGVVGAAVIAAGIGVYAYVKTFEHDNSEHKEKEEVLEEETEYESEPSYDAIPIPSTQKDSEDRNPPRTKQDNLKKDKEKTRQYQPYAPFIKSPDLEDILKEEADGEPAPYDLSREQRDALISEGSLTSERTLQKYYGEALKAYDFKVAATYVNDINQMILHDQQELCTVYDICPDEDLDSIGNYHQRVTYANHFFVRYNLYLDQVLTDCGGYDPKSVFRKVMWMNIFIAENEDIFTNGDSWLKLDLVTLLNKGNQALEAVEYCQNE